MTIPPCQCDVPGHCPRYGRAMEGRLFELCRTRDDYRRLWDGRWAAACGPAERCPTPAAPAAGRAEDPPCGVVVGSYGFPRLIELQVCLIRATCGPVPILVADDCSPGCGARAVPESAF